MSPLLLSRLRLASGLILFLFVLGHFANHTMGIVSLRAMNEGLKYSIMPWRSTLGEILIVAALVTHALLAVWALYARRNLRMKFWEFFQLASGFAIPVMLAAHVLASRGAYEAFGVEIEYGFQLYAQWVASPLRGIVIFSAMLVVWIHACIGWHHWLRYYSWYSRFTNWFLAAAILVPTLAAAGVISGGYRVLRLSQNEKWVERILKNANAEPGYQSFVYDNETLIISGVILTLATVLSVHFFRWLSKRRASGLSLQYRDIEKGERQEYRFSPGQTLLEHLRDNRVPHASVCGGRGRCSTCRVKVEEGAETLPSLSPSEARILKRLGAPENVRLACQIRPETDLAVTALLLPTVGAREAFSMMRHKSGEEQDIAVLFADIRAFTKLSETQLPFDTAFLLNRYFAAMGEAIEESGGHLDKFIGDGVMALFGVDEDLETGCRKAIIAAERMFERIAQLNSSLKDESGEVLRIGVGIHSGTAIIGNMGYKHATGLTAIGDVVNTASRLETMNKEFGSQLVVSERTVKTSGLELSGGTLKQANIRGRNEPLPVFSFENAPQIKQELVAS